MKATKTTNGKDTTMATATKAEVNGVKYDIIARESLDDTPRLKEYSGAANMVTLRRPSGQRAWTAYENADGKVWGMVRTARYHD